jgi:hypothetical protein
MIMDIDSSDITGMVENTNHSIDISKHDTPLEQGWILLGI